MKHRLDKTLVARKLIHSRSQAENLIRLGKVKVNGTTQTKAGFQVSGDDTLEITAKEQYISRAGLKLASVAAALGLQFKGKTVLDVGSSTGGFTDYALQHGAKHVIAVDVGTNQLHPSLRTDKKIELHEKTDIRDFKTNKHIDIVVIDVSFISLRDILPHIAHMVSSKTEVVAMVKPQFEAENDALKHKGVIKNDSIRRRILKSFELWVNNLFIIADKRDSDVAGAKGNRERFYLLKRLSKGKT